MKLLCHSIPKRPSTRWLVELKGCLPRLYIDEIMTKQERAWSLGREECFAILYKHAEASGSQTNRASRYLAQQALFKSHGCYIQEAWFPLHRFFSLVAIISRNNATRWILLKGQVPPVLNATVHGCLLGLVTRGILDQKCPNVLDYGVGRHSISQATLIRHLDRQLARHDPRPDLDIGCESLHIHSTAEPFLK